MSTRTIGLILVWAVALALVTVACLMTLANQTENGYVDRLVNAGLTHDEAEQLVDAYEDLDMSPSAIDDSIDQIEELNQYVEQTNDSLADQGMDSHGCSADERYDPSTGWCEPRG